MPRTRQSERIRTRIVHQRGQYADSNESEAVDEGNNQQGLSSTVAHSTTSTRKKRVVKKRKRKCKKSRRKPKYKIVYEIDEVTGEKIAIKKKTRRYKKRRKTKKRKVRVRRVIVPKTVKNRLARQLGIRPPQRPGQSLPEMKVLIQFNIV